MYVYILCYKCTISLHVIRLKYYLVFVVFVLVFAASFPWKKKHSSFCLHTLLLSNSL